MNDEFDEQALNRETDSLLARMQERRLLIEKADGGGLVYKTRDDSLAQPQEAAPDANEWLQSRLEEVCDIIGGEMGRTRKELRDEIVARLDEIENRLDALESRVDDLAGTKTASAAPVIALRGRVDVVA
jgi:hypothetical protein